MMNTLMFKGEIMRKHYLRFLIALQRVDRGLAAARIAAREFRAPATNT